MSDEPFRYNRYDRDPYETPGDARIRQREIDEKRNNVGRGVGNANTSSSNTSFHNSGTGSYEYEPLSNTALYIGIPLLILAFLLWRGYLPFGDTTLLGIPLVTILVGAGMLCVAFRFIAKLAAIVLVLIGGLMGFGTLMAIVGGAETVNSSGGNLFATAVVIIVGVVLFKIASRLKQST